MTMDQTKRKAEIARLEARCAKAEATINLLRLDLAAQEKNQIARLAELRCQKILLQMAERAERQTTARL